MQAVLAVVLEHVSLFTSTQASQKACTCSMQLQSLGMQLLCHCILYTIVHDDMPATAGSL